jgi:hypothetical protein
MTTELEGVDRAIPRPVRHDLITWRDAGLITITHLTLPTQPTDREIRWAINQRWVEHSPLRRAALAALEHLQQRGTDLSDVELAGYRLPTPKRLAGHLKSALVDQLEWAHYQSVPLCLADGEGCLEVLAPTRARPLDALLFTPGPSRGSLSS